MSSPFFGIETGARALRTAQTLVDIANQNIANANTPGFSRQVGVVTETTPFPSPVVNQSGVAGQLGTGVQITEINRTRDLFADFQYRNQVASQGSWDAQKDTLNQIEAVVNEPSTSGLSTLVTKYFQSWQEVANNPADSSVRSNLLEQGKALANSLQSTVQQYQIKQRDADTQISLSVDSVNNFATQIAGLNTQISQIEAGGLHANDLRDQRDLLVDKLSQMTKVTTAESSDGSLNLYLGGHQLVDRSVAHPLGLDKSGQFAKIIWNDGTLAPANVGAGKIAGLLTSRDVIIKGRIDAINLFAQRLISQVNAVHAGGVGIDGTSGLNFFSGKDATDIAVDPTLTANHVAAAREKLSPTVPGQYVHGAGDSSNAIALAQLQNSLTQGGATGLTNGQAVGVGTMLGVDVANASVNKSFSIAYTAGTPPTVAVSDGTTTVNATWTVASDQKDGTAPTRDIYTLDTGTMGVRLTLSVPASTGANAAFAGLSGQTVTSAGPATISNQYAQEISTIGVLSSTAKSQSANQAVLVDQVRQQRQQVSGVSLDEEATHMVQYQRAYQAAARVINIMDGMLDTLINHTKL